MNSTLMMGAVFAQMLVRPWSQTNSPLDERVAADFKGGADAALVHYAVPAMSGVQRLPDVYPYDGQAGGTVGIVMAQDEYEPGSFLVYPKKDLGKVQLEVGELKNRAGDVFPKADLDLKVVKVWYQNKNAWYSYFADTGTFKLVPELLLNDEDLIRVDTAKEANYARLTEKDGTVREQWINPPRQLDRAFYDYYRGGGAFASMKPNFADAETLRPVTLRKGEFKQFFLTAHARKGTKPGVYRGEVKIKSKSKGEGEQWKIPVAIRVLDFVLPDPMCYFDDNLPFYVNFYTYESLGCIKELNGGDHELAKRQFLATMKDHVAHGHTINWLHDPRNAEGRECVPLMKEAGCRQDVFVVWPSELAALGLSSVERDASMSRNAETIFSALGCRNVYVGYGDEPPPSWLEAVRPFVEAGHRAGLKFILAGSNNIFRKSGYQFDWHNINMVSEDDSTTRLWNQLGSSPHIAWYAKQHVGVENPDFNRRQNGMAAYLSNYSALSNYAHHYGPYNDDSEGYKPMVFTYGHYRGVIDTLQWEGFREGLDDIRYATVLVKLARKAAKQQKDIPLRYAGNKALQFLAAFRKDEDSLDACRAEMIAHILKLKGMGGM